MNNLLKNIICISILLVSISSCQKKQDDKKVAIQVLAETISSDSLSYKEKIEPTSQLVALYRKAGNDSMQKHYLDVLAELYYYTGDIQGAKGCLYQEAEIAKKNNDENGLATAYNNIAIVCDESSQTDSATKYYKLANDRFEQLKDSVFWADGLVNISITYKKTGAYKKAIFAGLQAAEIFGLLDKQEGLSASYSIVGSSFKDLNQLDKALYYHKKALDIRKEEKDSLMIASSLNNIGNVYRHKKNYDTALYYYLDALAIKERTADEITVARTIDNIAELYFEQQEYDKASLYFEQALAIRERDTDLDGYLTTTHRLCRLYLQTGEFSKAKPLAIKARSILEHSNFEKHKYDNALILSELYRTSGNYYEAYNYANSALSLKDSLFSTEMSEQVSRLETEFRTKEQEQQLLFAGKLKKEQEHTINTQKLYIILLFALLCFLIVISYLIYRLSKQRKKAKERVEVLMSELNHRVENNLQVISSMLKLQIASVNDASSKLLLANAKNRVESMWVIHGLLHEQKYTGVVDMHSFITSLAKNLNTTFSESQEDVDFSIDVANIQLATDIAIPLGLIINELLTNIFKHGKCSSEKFVQIQLTRNAKDVYYLIISDNCLKWDVELMKGKESGLGLDLIDTLVSQIGGSWQVVSNVDGTVSAVKF